MTRAPDIVLDTRGEVCPIPVIKTADAIRTLPPGGVVLVISDDPAIAFDLPAWARSAGCACEPAGHDGREFRFEVSKEDTPT